MAFGCHVVPIESISGPLGTGADRVATWSELRIDQGIAKGLNKKG
jgi:hypothetical protein